MARSYVHTSNVPIVVKVDGNIEHRWVNPWYDARKVPALRTDMYYWRMPAFPTHELIYQWHLWNQHYRVANKVTIY